MLFLTNFAAIVLSAALVFLMIGVRPHFADADRQHFIARHRIALAVVVLLGLSVPLMKTLMDAAHEVQLRSEVSNLLRKRLPRPQEHKLDSVKLQVAKDHVAVSAVVQTSQFIEPHEVQALQSELTTLIGRPVQLDIQQLQLARKAQANPVEGKDYLGGGVVQRTAPKAQPPSTTATIAKAQETTQASLTALLSSLGVTGLIVQSLGLQPNGDLQIDVTASQTQAIEPSSWQVAAASISHNLGVPVEIRADVTSADSSQILKFRDNSSRLTEREARDLQSFVRKTAGPGIGYVLAYPAAAESSKPELTNPESTKNDLTKPELTKPKSTKSDLTNKRLAAVQRYFRTAPVSSESDAQMSSKADANVIEVRKKTHLEVRGGQLQNQ